MLAIKLHYKSQLNRHYLKELMKKLEWKGKLKKLKKKMRNFEDIDIDELYDAFKRLVFIYLR